MKLFRFEKYPVFLGLIFWVFLLGVILALGGCATAGARSSAGTISLSEETDVERRSRIRLELAVSYFESGKMQVAQEEVRQALAINPSYVDAYNLHGLINMRLNDPVQAENGFRRALAIRSDDASALHNYAWFLCQQSRYAEAENNFEKLLGHPSYKDRGRTLMARGVCQKLSGNKQAAEKTLLKAHEIDAANSIVSFNLAEVLWERQEYSKARFYIRRVNNSDRATAESLWLGIKIERALGDVIAQQQLADQLGKRFSDSRQNSWYERGAFDE